jgi:hypothetical protein
MKLLISLNYFYLKTFLNQNNLGHKKIVSKIYPKNINILLIKKLEILDFITHGYFFA